MAGNKEPQFYSAGHEREEGRGNPAAQRHRQGLLARPVVRMQLALRQVLPLHYTPSTLEAHLNPESTLGSSSRSPTEPLPPPSSRACQRARRRGQGVSVHSPASGHYSQSPLAKP